MNLCRIAQMETVLLQSLAKSDSDDEIQSIPGIDPIADHLREGTFGNLVSQHFRKFLGEKGVSDFESYESLCDFVLKKYAESDIEERWRIIGFGIGVLQAFVQINFTGMNAFGDGFSCPEWLEKSLALDGEHLIPVIKNLDLFVLAKAILMDIDLQDNIHDSLISKWWCFRLLWVYQQLLEERSVTIFNTAESLIKEIDIESVSSTERQIHFYLEVATFNLSYFNIGRIKEAMEKASHFAGLTLTETGILGKRTKFQQREVAQLTLDIEKVSFDENIGLIDQDLDLPADLKLDDEVRLDKIAFSKERPQASLTKTECAIILGEYFLKKRSQPKDALLKEELMPYLDTVLANGHTNWCLKSTCLLERTKLEKSEKRGIERALMQIQTLVDNLPWKTEVNSSKRMDLIYSCKPSPFWALEYELVKILISVGSTKTALDLSIKLQLWEEVIGCYHQLGLRHKAVEVIKAQIEKNGESPILYCMLGDATDDAGHYLKAIEMSNGKSARAYRSLGNYYYERKNYEKTVEYLEKSLQLNSFQLGTLLRNGYAAMQIKAWDKAAQSYRNYCVYESDNFEAWNNLANAYINQGQKSRAWKVLQEAAKCDYDNWKVWDNIMVVSTDCAHFEEVIKAYHRILDLKNGKHVDAQVLTILVKAIRENLPDSYERPSKMFKKPALALFGRLSAENSSESSIWKLYANLVIAAEDEENHSEEDLFKSAQFMQKATASYMQSNKDWFKSSSSIVECLELGQCLAESCIQAGRATTNKIQSIQQSSSAKLTIKSMLSKVKQTHEGMPEEMQNACRATENSLDALVSLIDQLKT